MVLDGDVRVFEDSRHGLTMPVGTLDANFRFSNNLACEPESVLWNESKKGSEPPAIKNRNRSFLILVPWNFVGGRQEYIRRYWYVLGYDRVRKGVLANTRDYIPCHRFARCGTFGRMLADSFVQTIHGYSNTCQHVRVTRFELTHLCTGQ